MQLGQCTINDSLLNTLTVHLIGNGKCRDEDSCPHVLMNGSDSGGKKHPSSPNTDASVDVVK